MIPRARHHIVHVVGVFLLQRFVNFHGTVEIFLIPPAGNVKIWHFWSIQVRRHRLLLPELVVVGMRDEIVPGGYLFVPVILVEVGGRPERGVPLEGIVAVELKIEIRGAGFHHGRILQAVAQPERSVVMEIVTQELVGGRRLLGNRLERRVRVEHGHHRQPATVRDAEHACTPVVVGNMLEEPGDRVVGVSALVNGF